MFVPTQQSLSKRYGIPLLTLSLFFLFLIPSSVGAQQHAPPWLEPGIYAEYVYIAPIFYPNLFRNKTELRIESLNLRWEVLGVKEGIATLNVSVSMKAYVMLPPEPGECCPKEREVEMLKDFIINIRLKDRALLDEKGDVWGKWNMWLNLPADTQPPGMPLNEGLVVVSKWVDNISMVARKPVLEHAKYVDPEVPYEKEFGEISLRDAFHWVISPQVFRTKDVELWVFYWLDSWLEAEEGEKFNLTRKFKFKLGELGELPMGTPFEISAYLTYHIKAGLFIGSRGAGQNYIDDFITQKLNLVVPIGIALKSTNIDLSKDYEWGVERREPVKERSNLIKAFFPYIAIITASWAMTVIAYAYRKLRGGEPDHD